MPQNGKGLAALATRPLFNPATTYSPTHLSRAVQSAQQGLTSVFGMGTGISPAIESPELDGAFRNLPDLSRCFFVSPKDLRPMPHNRIALDIEYKLGGRSWLTPQCTSSILIDRCTCMPSKFYDQAERAISIRKLHTLPCFHIEPIKQVVFLCPSSSFWIGRSHLEECFPLICIQRLSQPNFATQPCR